MVTSFLEHEQIFTTLARAKELRRWAEWMITLGKRGDLHARRQALAILRSKDVLHKLFADLAPRYQDRPGGYTRIVKAGYRRGDAAPMCLIELVTDTVGKSRKKARTETKAEPSPPRPAATEPVDKASVAAPGDASESVSSPVAPDESRQG
jgi:large subunit ribosomal protein L17